MEGAARRTDRRGFAVDRRRRPRGGMRGSVPSCGTAMDDHVAICGRREKQHALELRMLSHIDVTLMNGRQ